MSHLDKLVIGDWNHEKLDVKGGGGYNFLYITYKNCLSPYHKQMNLSVCILDTEFLYNHFCTVIFGHSQCVISYILAAKNLRKFVP